MEDFELVGPNGTDINNEFLKQYRDALKNQYDASLSSLKQQNRNNQASIMSAANERGMMYSNFPQRSKIQAETDYLNNVAKLHSTYQTGLDKLRSNAVNAYNQIKAYEEAISDLEGTSGSGGTGSTGSTGGTDPTTTDVSGNNGDYDSLESAGYVPASNSSNRNQDSNRNLVSAITSGVLSTLALGPLGGILGGYLGSKYGTGTGKVTGKIDMNAFNK